MKTKGLIRNGACAKVSRFCPLIVVATMSALLLSGCSTAPSPLTVSPQNASVRIGDVLAMTGVQMGVVDTSGTWMVVGGATNGTISADGVYTPPPILPVSNMVTITYEALGQTSSSIVTVLNPTPAISLVQPLPLLQLSNNVAIAGIGFVSGSEVVQDGLVVPTLVIDSTHLRASLNVTSVTVTSTSIAISNPEPGASLSSAAALPVQIAPVVVTPQGASVRVGSIVTLSATQQGQSIADGSWSVVGAPLQGRISNDGVYASPAALPSPNIATVIFNALGQTATSTITLLNPTPAIAVISPSSLDQISTPIVITGSGFLEGSQVIAAGRPIVATFVDSAHLKATLLLASTNATTIDIAVLNPAPGASSSPIETVRASVLPLTIASPSTFVHLGETVEFSAEQNGMPVTGGTWTVGGSSASGQINKDGLYTAPSVLPLPNVIPIYYRDLGQTATAKISIINRNPKITDVAPAVLSQYSTNIVVTGSDFTKDSKIEVNGLPVLTSFQDTTHLQANVVVPSNTVSVVALTVSNPDPGSVTSNEADVPVAIPPLSVTPATLEGGNFTATLKLPGMPPSPVVTADGTLLTASSIDAETITVNGYLPFWRSGAMTFTLSSGLTTPPFASIDVPIKPTAVSYDVASRFAMQGGFGPRHDIIERIQQIGIEAFVDEQIKTPPVDYLDPFNGRKDFLLHIVGGDAQLRLRTAWAFQSFIPEQGIFFQPSVLPWEETLEAHAFSNFRQIMLDAASDPNVTTLLNLPGNQAPRQPGQHPNQNFARELLQLFTIGPVLLNEDGTLQVDTSGIPVPAYDENTVIDLSRAFTGWTYAKSVNEHYSAYGIDYTQPLISLDWQHDHGSKTIFGDKVLAAGQTAEQDRDQVLDAIFMHPNVPPFISRRLIQRLVKSQPSPAYIARISTVFKDDGSGIRGNLAAVVKAILLDSEARAGDTQPRDDDGFVQDPLSAEVFAMILMDINDSDGSASYYPDQLGEPWWFTHSVFGYYSPDYVIPGTSIISPEFQLLTGTSIVQRSQLLWGMINGPQVGFQPWRSSWLSTTFPTLPLFLDALDHLLYHGRMKESERDAITSYCGSLPDLQSQLRAALFLALSNDAYTVVH